MGLEKAIGGFEQSQKSATKFIALTAEEQEELRKREERKDRLQQNYLCRKANGKQREYEERTKSEKRKKMEEKKAALRAEDMAKGVYILTGSLPHFEPQKAANSTRTATQFPTWY